MGWTAEELGFKYLHRGKSLLSTTAMSLLGPSNLLFNGQSDFFLEIKGSKSEADHSLPSNTEVKGTQSYTSTPHASPYCDNHLNTGTYSLTPISYGATRRLWNT